MKNEKILGLVCCGLLLVGCGGGSSVVSSSANGDAVKITTSIPFEDAPQLTQEEKDAYLKAINDARAEAHTCGETEMPAVDSLTWNEHLYLASAEHNEDMLTSDIIDEHHRGSNTDSDWTTQVQELDHASYMQERVENNGYTNWAHLTENLTLGTNTDTAEKAIQSWLDSEGHCKNLMDPNVTEVGMAHLEDAGSHYTHYWTQNFGKPQ